MTAIIHKNPRCKARLSMNGHCLVCDAARANGTSDERMGDIATANAARDPDGTPTRPTHVPGKSVPDVPGYIPARQRQRIDHWDDERALGNSLIITLKAGWRWPIEEGTHVCGFDTVTAARAALRQTIPCSCPTCSAQAPDGH